MTEIIITSIVVPIVIVVIGVLVKRTKNKLDDEVWKELKKELIRGKGWRKLFS